MLDVFKTKNLSFSSISCFGKDKTRPIQGRKISWLNQTGPVDECDSRPTLHSGDSAYSAEHFWLKFAELCWFWVNVKYFLFVNSITNGVIVVELQMSLA